MECTTAVLAGPLLGGFPFLEFLLGDYNEITCFSSQPTHKKHEGRRSLSLLIIFLKPFST